MSLGLSWDLDRYGDAGSGRREVVVVEGLKRYESLGMEMVFLPSQQRELIAKEILPEFR
jgi:hypothetical protein